MSVNAKTQSTGLVKLVGIIKNYRCTRAEANFVFTESDKTKMGVIAITAAIAGLGGPAISTASNLTALEEEADYVEFDLNGTPVRGWVWRSPFKESDRILVAAEWRNDHYEVAGIARPIDRTIALYPHCSRGVTRHIQSAAKWWFISATLLNVLTLFLALLAFGIDDYWDALCDGVFYVLIGFYLLVGFITFNLARKWMVFVRLAEKVFRTIGSSDPSNIDLVKSSKDKRKSDDPGEFGTFYFRY